MMSSPCLSSGSPKPADPFEHVWRQLRECHHNALQELEAKVSKLKKERCLDAKRLEVFYSCNKQLKEQNKALQDTIGLLEERLRAGECDRCAILGEDLRNNQDQNVHLVSKLMNERRRLEDENRKLQTELQKVKMSRSEIQQASSPESEEGIIPDSPVLPSSLPVANRLKKRRNGNKDKHIRYAEMPLSQSNKSRFRELNQEPGDATQDPGRAEVLVPNTCELDTSQISNDVNLQPEEVIAETCAFELLDKPHMTRRIPEVIKDTQPKTETASGQQSSAKSPWKSDVHSKSQRCFPPLFTLIHSQGLSKDRSPSLLPRVKRISEEASINKAKRKKEESEPGENKEEKQEEVGIPDVINGATSSLSSQSYKRPPDSKVQVSCASPTFNKPNVRGEAKNDEGGRRGKPLQVQNASHEQHGGEDESPHKVEPAWSVDPALAMSLYDSEWRAHENDEQQCHGEMPDTDCTWVSHSVLQRWGGNAPDRRSSVSGLGQKAVDSLDMMFDTTGYGEYKSCNGSQLDQSQPCEEEEEEDAEDPHESSLSQRKAHKTQRPAFAHVAVVRKKDERRKLKGTTCKECEVYYAHLPEEEKQKKLSACSRHRFLYIPPCTPENFWEVGFPSTQTCIERGYIKEEKIPQARSRRRQPFNALFSPKREREEN